MNVEDTIERICEHVENGHADKAVMACLRLARHGKDYMSAAIFMRELYPNKTAVVRALYDDMQSLTREAQKFVFTQSLERWLETHTLPFNMGTNDDDEERNVLSVAVGELDSEIEQWESSIRDLTVPAGMAPFDMAAFTDRYNAEKAGMRWRIKALQTLKERVKTNCLNYAIQVERQLQGQRKTQGFLEDAQSSVNNYFRAHSEDVYSKLQRATQLVGSSHPEDASLVLTEVRRAMKAAADYFYPPVSGKVRCADGVERTLGDEQFLNRIQEFLATHIARSTSATLLEAEFNCWATYFRRINDIASKGVHGTVSLVEAKQGLIGLYMFLHNLCAYLDTKSESPGQTQSAA